MSELAQILPHLPHKGPMLLLDAVSEVGPDRIRTRVQIREDHILLEADGTLSTLVAIELFAQSAAALMVHRSMAKDASPVMGALLGSRTFDVLTPHLAVGDVLEIEAVERWGQGQLAQLSCELFRESAGEWELVARGAINVVSGSLSERPR